MKRNMDLVRAILLFVENQDVNSGQYENITLDGYTPMEVMMHVKIMEGYGLLQDCTYYLRGNTTVRTITWEGYDYLDKVRDNTIWKKTKDTIVSNGLPLIFDTIKTVSTAFIAAATEGVVNAILKNGGQQ